MENDEVTLALQGRSPKKKKKCVGTTSRCRWRDATTGLKLLLTHAARAFTERNGRSATLRFFLFTPSSARLILVGNNVDLVGWTRRRFIERVLFSRRIKVGDGGNGSSICRCVLAVWPGGVNLIFVSRRKLPEDNLKQSHPKKKNGEWE